MREILHKPCSGFQTANLSGGGCSDRVRKSNWRSQEGHVWDWRANEHEPDRAEYMSGRNVLCFLATRQAWLLCFLRLDCRPAYLENQTADNIWKLGAICAVLKAFVHQKEKREKLTAFTSWCFSFCTLVAKTLSGNLHAVKKCQKTFFFLMFLLCNRSCAFFPSPKTKQLNACLRENLSVLCMVHVSLSSRQNNRNNTPMQAKTTTMWIKFVWAETFCLESVYEKAQTGREQLRTQLERGGGYPIFWLLKNLLQNCAVGSGGHWCENVTGPFFSPKRTEGRSGPRICG